MINVVLRRENCKCDKNRVTTEQLASTQTLVDKNGYQTNIDPYNCSKHIFHCFELSRSDKNKK